MAFLFGKSKKHQNSTILSQPKDGSAPTLSGSNSSIPTVNGSAVAARDRDKDRGQTHSPTPNSSVNNSLNSSGGNATPSPEQKVHREKSDLDYQVSLFELASSVNLDGTGASYIRATPTSFQTPRSQSAGPPTSLPVASSPNASLYPWAQRRFNFTTSHPNPFPRYGAAVNSVANKEGDIYLMGGLINGSTVKGDLWLVEAGGGSLACYPLSTTSEGPGPRVGHASLIVGNAFIVYGGDTKMDDRDMLDDTLYLLNTCMNLLRLMSLHC